MARNNHGLRRIRCYLCDLFCGPREEHPRVSPAEVPFEIREASHKLANAATIVQGAARNLERSSSALRALAESVKNR